MERWSVVCMIAVLLCAALAGGCGGGGVSGTPGDFTASTMSPASTTGGNSPGIFTETKENPGQDTAGGTPPDAQISPDTGFMGASRDSGIACDLLGSWVAQGTYYRAASTGAWAKVGSESLSVASGDIDNDGNDDILVTQAGGTWVRYSTTKQWVRLGTPAVSITVGDMNNDGRKDLVGSWTGQGTYCRDSASGAWIKMGSDSTAVAAGDLDGDGRDDLAVSQASGTWVRYTNPAQWVKVGTPATSLAVGDLNGDGHKDLAGSWSGQGTYYRDSVSGAWIQMGNESMAVASGDLDGDGRDDLVVSQASGTWARYASPARWVKLGTAAVCLAAGSLSDSPAPLSVITSLVPYSGSVGTVVTITGTGFGTARGTSTVTFSGSEVAADDYVSWSPSVIECRVPPGAVSGNVVVIVSGRPGTRVAFTVTEPKTWHMAEIIGDGPPLPQVAMDASGNAVAVWCQYGANYTRICASRYSGHAWTAPVIIDQWDYEGGGVELLQVAMNSNGYAIAVWHRVSGRIYASHYSGSTWSAAVPVSSPNHYAYFPRVAVDSGGTATAVWQEHTAGIGAGIDDCIICANRFSGSLWGTPERINTGTTGARNPRVAVDSSGNATAVWLQTEGSCSRICTNRFSAGSWGTAAVIDGDNTARGFYQTETYKTAQVVMDAGGNALVAWSTATWKICARRYSGGSWSAPVFISAPDTYADNPRIAMDSSGNATAVWVQGGAILRFCASRYSGGAWGTPALLDQGNNTAQGDTYPQVAVDTNGTAIAVWPQYDGSYWGICANRYAGGTWGTASVIDAEGPGEVQFSPQIQVAMDSSGNAIAVWARKWGNIYANSFY